MNPELFWLDEPWERVAHALKDDRMPAGLLILGRPGVGRGRFAESIARALLCLVPRPDATACGRCAACREVSAGTHPDFIAVHPEEDKKTIGVEQIRELTRGLALTAGARGVRCAIVSPAETLTTQASNALLKTLEEPPAGVTLILIADSTFHLPATVISRCLRLPIPVPAQEQALRWLDGRSQRADWPLLLALAGGAPLAAEKIAEDYGDDLQSRLESLIGAAARRNDPLSVAAGFAKWSLPRYASLVGWLAWAALRSATPGVAPNVSWPREIAALASRADAKRLAQTWREANRLANDAVSLNAALARERLILLFVNAFDRRNRGSEPS